jgi:hypothetical protein
MDELLKDLISVPTLGLGTMVFGILYFGVNDSYKALVKECKELEAQVSNQQHQYDLEKATFEIKISKLEDEVSRLQWKLRENGIYDEPRDSRRVR